MYFEVTQIWRHRFLHIHAIGAWHAGDMVALSRYVLSLEIVSEGVPVIMDFSRVGAPVVAQRPDDAEFGGGLHDRGPATLSIVLPETPTPPWIASAIEKLSDCVTTIHTSVQAAAAAASVGVLSDLLPPPPDTDEVDPDSSLRIVLKR
ncbi:MAG: hypothetical protein AAF334_03545 [Pseudomonadota bacterium]